MQRGQQVTPQDLLARHGVNGELDGCEKLSASTYIELLGLINASPGVARPTFDSTIVTEFYRESQDVVVDVATSNYRADILSEMRDGRLFDDEAKDLLSRYGPRIWGTDRSHLLDAGKAATELYPSDLYFDRPEDHKRIVFWVRCWMAKRALRKASEAGKKGSGAGTGGANAGVTGSSFGTPGTPKKRKRISSNIITAATAITSTNNSNSNNNIAGTLTTAGLPSAAARRQHYSAATDSAPIQQVHPHHHHHHQAQVPPVKRKRGRPRRVDYQTINYGESSSASDEQEPDLEDDVHDEDEQGGRDDADGGADESSASWEDQDQDKDKHHEDQETQRQNQSDTRKTQHAAWREPSPAPDHLTPTTTTPTTTKPGPKRQQVAPYQHHQRHSSNPQPSHHHQSGTTGGEDDRSRSSSAMARASKVVKLPVDKAKLSVFEAWEGWKEQEARSRGQTTTGYSAIRDADQTYIPRTHTSVPSTPAMAHIDSKPIYQQPTPGAPPPSQGRYDSTQPYPRYADDRRDDRETSIKSDPQNPTSATSATTPNLPPLGFHAVNHKLPPSSSSSPNPPHPNTLPPIRPTTEHSIPVHSHPHSHPHQLPPLQHSPPHSQSRSPPTKPLPSATSLSLPTPTIPKPPSTEEITSFRRQILSNILTLLSSPTPSDIAINSLHPLISTIRPHLSSIPSQRLKTLDSTFATWTAMHGALSDFRRLTGYSGRAGDDWQAYRRGLSFRERVVVMEAENQLGTWRLERRREGLWVDEERGKDGGRGLDRELAELFEGVLGGVGGVGREDLLDGLGEYDGELLRWFR